MFLLQRLTGPGQGYPNTNLQGAVPLNTTDSINAPTANQNGVLIQNATQLPTRTNSRQVQTLPRGIPCEEKGRRGAISSAFNSLDQSPLAAKLQSEKDSFLSKIYKGVFCLDVSACLVGIAIICIPGVNVAAVSAVIAVTAVTAISMVLYNMLYKVESAINVATESAVVLRPAGEAAIGALNNSAVIVEDITSAVSSVSSSLASVARDNGKLVSQYPVASLVGCTVGAAGLAVLSSYNESEYFSETAPLIATSIGIIATTVIGAKVAETVSTLSSHISGYG